MSDFPSAPPPVAASAQPATFGQRLIAYLIDSAVGFGLALPAIVLFFIGSAIGGGFGIFVILIAVLFYFGALAAMIYIMVIGQGKTGQTPGKRTQGIQLVGDNGQPIGGGMVFVRYLLASLLGSFCYIGYLWMLWDGEKKTLYDKILGNQVVAGPQGSITPIFPDGKPF